jgi:arginyl-tRNA synthetase
VGEYLQSRTGIVARFNVVKGFLNLALTDRVWLDVFRSLEADPQYGEFPDNGRAVMVEYSSPNTNKPLHLGHLRNNFLGYSVAEILKANGY